MLILLTGYNSGADVSIARPEPAAMDEPRKHWMQNFLAVSLAPSIPSPHPLPYRRLPAFLFIPHRHNQSPTFFPPTPPSHSLPSPPPTNNTTEQPPQHTLLVHAPQNPHNSPQRARRRPLRRPNRALRLHLRLAPRLPPNPLQLPRPSDRRQLQRRLRAQVGHQQSQ